MCIRIILYSISVAIFFISCKHEPFPEIIEPGDTTSFPIDTTGSGNKKPCHPDTVYFNRQLLPILVSNCAIVGCHDPVYKQKGVILTDYDQIMNTADVDPFDPDGSKLYKFISHSDPDKRMPPPPRQPLTTEQILLVRKWIQQGAQNLECEIDCDTLNVTYSVTIKNILSTHCTGCHSPSLASGGVNLADYNNASAVALDGRLYGAASHAPGFKPMPQNGAKIDECKLKQLKIWIDAGAPNN